jgi:anti-sigma factor RsiW
MTCEEIRNRAPLYLSGEMPAEERALFHRHLAGCAVCEQEIETQSAMDARIARALGSVMPDASRVERRVRAQMAAERRQHRWLGIGAVAAVLLLAAIGAAYLVRPATPAPRWFADAALDHHDEVVEGQRRRWRTDPPEVEKVTLQTGLSVSQAAGLAAPGYSLERAKMCGIDGQRMLHLVFSDGRNRYSLFVSQHQSAQESVRVERRGAEQVAGFETGRYRAAVVSGVAAGDCAKLARIAESRL